RPSLMLVTRSQRSPLLLGHPRIHGVLIEHVANTTSVVDELVFSGFTNSSCFPCVYSSTVADGRQISTARRQIHCLCGWSKIEFGSRGCCWCWRSQRGSNRSATIPLGCCSGGTGDVASWRSHCARWRSNLARSRSRYGRRGRIEGRHGGSQFLKIHLVHYGEVNIRLAKLLRSCRKCSQRLCYFVDDRYHCRELAHSFVQFCRWREMIPDWVNDAR